MRYRIDLKREREKRNMTQAKLAELIGVTEKSVSKWESGRGQPSYENILKICEVFNIDINKIDSEAIAKRRINIILNSCLVFINLLLVLTIFMEIIKLKDYNTFSNNSNALTHLIIYAPHFRINANRFYFILLLFMIIPVSNVFLPFILKKHIVLLSFIAILNIAYCIITFKNLKIYGAINYIVIIFYIFSVIVILFLNYMTKKKLKGEYYDKF